MRTVACVGIILSALFGWNSVFSQEETAPGDAGGTMVINGSTTLDGTRLSGEVTVNGSFTASKAVLNSLEVNGQVTLKKCSVNGETVVNGGLVATATKFGSEVSVASPKITFDGCSVASLRVRGGVFLSGKQIVELRGGTHIDGPVVVESGNGEIWVFSGSKVSGTVEGAQVIQK